MGLLRSLLQAANRWRLRVLDRAVIKDIPTDEFNTLAQALLAAGWEKTYEYQGPDAWIDRGHIKLRRDGARLSLTWDNWTEGQLEGPRPVVTTIADDAGYTVSDG